MNKPVPSCCINTPEMRLESLQLENERLHKLIYGLDTDFDDTIWKLEQSVFGLESALKKILGYTPSTGDHTADIVALGIINEIASEALKE